MVKPAARASFSSAITTGAPTPPIASLILDSLASWSPRTTARTHLGSASTVRMTRVLSMPDAVVLRCSATRSMPGMFGVWCLVTSSVGA